MLIGCLIFYDRKREAVQVTDTRQEVGGPERKKPVRSVAAQARTRGVGADKKRVRERPSSHASSVLPEKPSGGSQTNVTVSSVAEEQEQTARQTAVVAWENRVEALRDKTQAPSAQQAIAMKQAFDELHADDRLDAIQYALLLLPDMQISVIYPILLDKSQSEEVLDAIFDDVLNRDEQIKNPLMRELRKDKEHPLFFESARILDVVEPES